MANEFVHGSAGTTLTQAEFEAVGLHVCNSQATGDLIYASSATQLSRLAIGAADTVFTSNGTVPSWSATPILNTAIAKGTWTASGTWTIPAVTLGGTVSVNSQIFDAGAGIVQINTASANIQGLTIQNTTDTDSGGALILQQISTSPANNDTVGSIRIKAYDAGKDVLRIYAEIDGAISDVTDDAADGILYFYLLKNNVQTQLLSMTADALNLASGKVLQVNSVQVVGARVVDARCDDAVNSGDSTTDGVIDALRDAMISHGLIAAA